MSPTGAVDSDGLSKPSMAVAATPLYLSRREREWQ